MITPQEIVDAIEQRREILALKARMWDMTKIFMQEDQNGRAAMGGRDQEKWFKQQIAEYEREMHRICKD
jgi:hypothetical protein